MSDGGTWDSDPSSTGTPAPEGPGAATSDAQASAPPPAPPPVPTPLPAPTRRRQLVATGGYPIDVDVEVPEHIARWRPLVQWILAIPLLIVVYVLGIVAEVCAFIGWFAALFTGRLPEGLGNIIAGYYRYYWRSYSYAWFLRDKYPPFGLAASYGDPDDDPAWFEVRPGEGLSRLRVLFRIILIIPQAIVLFFLGIALYFAVLVAFFAVLFTGRWPAGLRDFVVGAHRWILRVSAWFLLLADPYPPFSLH
jgi:Domain of unknown function (DUF4389)